VTPRSPEPGSPWARLCPDAWPREWLDPAGELPEGFSRPATLAEADLITGRVTEAGFVAASGGRTARPAAPPTARSGRKPNPVVRKLLGYRSFLDGLPTLNPRLSTGAVAVWVWLWTCERKGHARCTVRRLAKRFGVVSSTAGRWLGELRAAGFVRVVRRGRQGKSASVVRVRPTPGRVILTQDRPTGGTT